MGRVAAAPSLTLPRFAGEGTAAERRQASHPLSREAGEGWGGGNRGWTYTILLTTALSLSACTVGPDYTAPDLTLPAQWGEAATAVPEKPDLSRWWERLRDPTLTALVEEAVAGNLDVAAAKARIREARATHRQAAGALYPSLDASASATRSDSGGAASETGLGNGFGGPRTQYQAGFDAGWELDLFGANQRREEAARYGTQAAEEELRSTLLTLVGDVTANYVALCGYRARLDLARRTVGSQRQTLALTRTKVEAGASSAVDLAKASAQASGTEANVPALETSYAEALHRLGVLTGRAPSALAARLRDTAPIPAPRLPLPLGVPADLLRSRPDIRLAERQLAQYTAKIGQAEAARYPSVSLTGSVSTSGAMLGDLARNSSVGWSFGPSISVPLFNAGQLQAAVAVAEAQRDQHAAAFRSAVLSALEGVENAIVALARERTRNATLAASAESYREAARLARVLYQSGSAGFLDVLDAERSLYSAEDSLIQSQVAIATDYIALNKALGGGWDGVVDAGQ